jgi:hypothetical protein
VNGFSYVGMTLYKTGVCEYETYIGDLTDCDQYPFYMQDNFSSSGLTTDSYYDIYGTNCGLTACGLPSFSTSRLGVGICIGTRITAVYVKLFKNVNNANYDSCDCWQAEIIFKTRVTSNCGDDCTWTTRTDCPFGNLDGYTNHVPTDKNMIVVKKTNDSIGDNAILNLAAVIIYDGGNATYCPGSSDINTLCGDEYIGGGILLGETKTIVANSPSSLLGNYTMANITPACDQRTTSLTTMTYSAFYNFDGDRDCTTPRNIIPSFTVNVTNLTIS